MTSLDYFSIRLKALRAGFADGRRCRYIAATADVATLTGYLEESLYREEISALRTRPEGDVTARDVMTAVAEGIDRITRTVADMIRPLEPAIASFLFARIDLEQIKSALRVLGATRGAGRTPLPTLLNLRGGKGWVTGWENRESPSHLMERLVAVGHPLAFAPVAERKNFDQADAERRFEKNYFKKVAHLLDDLPEEAERYVADQHDRVNLQLASLLRKSNASSEVSGSLYLAGPGKINEAIFIELTRHPAEQYADLITKLFGFRPDPDETRSPHRMAIALRRHHLARYRRAARNAPHTMMEMILFVEEFSAERSNLALALGAGGDRAAAEEVTPLFITREEF